MTPIDDNWDNLLRYKYIFYKMKSHRRTKGAREPHLLTWLLFYKVSSITRRTYHFNTGGGGDCKTYVGRGITSFFATLKGRSYAFPFAFTKDINIKICSPWLKLVIPTRSVFWNVIFCIHTQFNISADCTRFQLTLKKGLTELF